MFFAFLSGMKPQAVFGPSPLVSAVTASSGSAGLCNKGSLLSSATIDVAWSFSYNGGTGTGYTLQLLRSGTLVTSLSMGATSYTYTVGFKQSGVFNQFTSNYTFTVQVVRGDGVVTSTASASPWQVLYGTCS